MLLSGGTTDSYQRHGSMQVSPIRNLSDGQKCRVCLAWLAWQNPNMLFLDKPTNHLDIETISGLTNAILRPSIAQQNAINEFEGGMTLSAMISDSVSRQHRKSGSV